MRHQPDFEEMCFFQIRSLANLEGFPFHPIAQPSSLAIFAIPPKHAIVHFIVSTATIHPKFF